MQIRILQRRRQGTLSQWLSHLALLQAQTGRQRWHVTLVSKSLKINERTSHLQDASYCDLCRSSCSTTCEQAPLTNAAKAGLVFISGNGTTSQGPEVGPIFLVSSMRAIIAAWSRPLPSVQARVSKKKSFVRSITAGGMSS